MNQQVLQQAEKLFGEYYSIEPEYIAYAPGRVEVLGNHTDYNQGFVLSSAIEQGTWFLAARSPDEHCRIVAGDVREQIAFPAGAARPDPKAPWADYVKGVWAGLSDACPQKRGFLGLFLGNVPLGAGLSSSAALEISAGLALAALCRLDIPPLEMARIGQKAEHEFAGVKCGLLDQITSLFGQSARLVKTDFRSLDVTTIPVGDEARLLIANTGVKHSLVDSEYNLRREECRRAMEHFAAVFPERNISALRDVDSADWETGRAGLDDRAARRALHVIGENERVIAGVDCLLKGDLITFGELMFASHESSRLNFENSCPELDYVIATARSIDGVLGARLSGGGFGGGAVLLLRPESVEAATDRLSAAYAEEYGHPCAILTVRPAAGARLFEK